MPGDWVARTVVLIEDRRRPAPGREDREESRIALRGIERGIVCGACTWTTRLHRVRPSTEGEAEGGPPPAERHRKTRVIAPQRRAREVPA